MLQIDPELPATVRGDPSRLQQILLNLLTNAVKFTATGEVILKVDWVQADSSTTRRFGGTGLGLSIVAHLVEAMSGRITADSEVGVGSTFTVTVPLPADAAAPTLGQGVTQPAVSLLTRHQPTRTAITLGLVQPPTDVASFTTWCDRALASGEPSVLLVDDQMLPEPTAPDTDWHSWRQDLPVTATVIVLTRCDHESYSNALQPGWQRLRKPFSPQSLQDAVAGPGRAAVASPPAGTVSASVPKLSAPDAGAVVLVAEDNPFNQKVILHQLRSLGLTADVVTNGELAVAAVAKRTYLAVFMDCQMPVMDGYEAAATIRRLDGACSQVPIVALTANAQAQDRARCYAAGMNAYLSKPVKLEAIADVLAELGVLQA